MDKAFTDLTRTIQSRIGIACDVTGNSSADFSDFYIRSAESEYEKPHGWFLHVEILNQTFRLEFGFDDSAGLLCKFYFSKINFSQISDELLELTAFFAENYFSLNFYCDDRVVALQEMSSIETPLNFKIKSKGRISGISRNDFNSVDLVLDFLFLCIFPLLPDQDDEEAREFLFEQGLPEGASKRVLVNKYERNPKNRLACIKHYGTSCFVCEFDFGKVYGDFAADYIHVHHIVPVSQMTENYRINPIEDLVPLCPNCHSAVHISNPPLSPKELKSRLIN